MQLRVEMFNAGTIRISMLNRSATFNQAGQLTNLPTALGGSGAASDSEPLPGHGSAAHSSSRRNSISNADILVVNGL